MDKSRYTILLMLFGISSIMGVLISKVITIPGLIAAITGGTILFFLLKDRITTWKKRNPFTEIEHRLDNLNWKPQGNPLVITKGNHDLFIELHPTKAMKINSLNIRFVGNANNDMKIKPFVSDLKDISRTITVRQQSSPESSKGVDLTYDPAREIGTTPALDYRAKIRAEHEWEGRLRLKFSLDEIGEQTIIIQGIVKLK